MCIDPRTHPALHTSGKDTQLQRTHNPQRPLELATLRLQNMVGVLSQCEWGRNALNALASLNIATGMHDPAAGLCKVHHRAKFSYSI